MHWVGCNPVQRGSVCEIIVEDVQHCRQAGFVSCSSNDDLLGIFGLVVWKQSSPPIIKTRCWGTKPYQVVPRDVSRKNSRGSEIQSDSVQAVAVLAIRGYEVSLAKFRQVQGVQGHQTSYANGSLMHTRCLSPELREFGGSEVWTTLPNLQIQSVFMVDRSQIVTDHDKVIQPGPRHRPIPPAGGGPSVACWVEWKVPCCGWRCGEKLQVFG